MSCRKGGPKKKAPRHQNSVAFKHNKHSKKTKQIANIGHDGLCPKCTGIIEWRKRYRKYKPLKAPRRCGSCEQKKITRAYHVLCNGCRQKRNVCAKCLLSKEEWKETEEEDEEEDDEAIDDEIEEENVEGKHGVHTNEDEKIGATQSGSAQDVIKPKEVDTAGTSLMSRKALKQKLEDPDLRERERRSIMRKLAQIT
mmetsp:Transcript_13958/g.34084  ORF Transcript_13958/g.34084 Transcript_13958/m.34084 type:complete len:197 (-) Transcript_13958:198-788(-)|eukprot:CAMPEP_0114511578 /NCGR_PEP_ID=MMETSP0109-20121206/14477_1 /TAXON_ID=29199 /ORGANISM="Chlorarachnion reptans, Strain CCCM449" /LENGTH=196 /DNA_ID=CAMNT_0001691125 /DNA_START=87 /DNA_END=677 /DNA_ORIENTATION=-